MEWYAYNFKSLQVCVLWHVMCLWKPCTFAMAITWNKRTSDLLYKNPHFFVITRPNQMGSSLLCREIVIFSLHEIILWFTHYFESYPCGKSNCNFFWTYGRVQQLCDKMKNLNCAVGTTMNFFSSFGYRIITNNQ